MSDVKIVYDKIIKFLIHTTKDGMENFFHGARLFDIKVPKKYGQYKV